MVHILQIRGKNLFAATTENKYSMHPLKNPKVFATMTIVEILVVADRKMYLADLTQNIKH